MSYRIDPDLGSSNETKTFDTIVIGAGAAGFMAAITAASQKQKVLLIDSNKKLCEKIRISGGGRCNFTNLNASYENYISENPNFSRSAFSNYSPEDFISLVEKHKIKFHEKKLGQLFCDESSQEIINMLKNEAHTRGVELAHPVKIVKIFIQEKELELDLAKKKKQNLKTKLKKRFRLSSEQKQNFEADKLIIATGGLSIPQLGVTSFGYDLAELLDVKVIEPRPGLVPLVLEEKLIQENLGASFDVVLSNKKMSFRENLLFTHKGLSGPATLQISNYWQQGEDIELDFCPGFDLEDYLIRKKKSGVKINPLKLLAELKQRKDMPSFSNKIDRDYIFSKNFLRVFAENMDIYKNVQEYSEAQLMELAAKLKKMSLCPKADEGFLKAEVTRGGIDTRELKQQNMELKSCTGLHFIGELVDVTGWLGGYNFQWAWSSGYISGLS